MTETSMLLWEVGCEELPAWACDQIESQVEHLVVEELVLARVLADKNAISAPDVFVGPRRFAVRMTVPVSTPEVREEKRGPAEGAPDQTKQGFARSLGLDVGDLEYRDGFAWGTRELAAQPTTEVWPGIAQRVLERINFAKPMRWGSGSQRFVRPIRWIVTLLDKTPIEYEVWGVHSGGVSRTHRFLGEQRELVTGDPEAYPRQLADAYVLIDQQQRRTKIVEGLDAAARQLGGEWSDPGNVLKEVVHLVEYPTVITGRFDEKYLELPERVLVTAMQSHQRYFAVRKGDGLAPAFLTVMNGDPAAVDTILPGYERVLKGRLDDAVFSFERDRERGLDDMASDASLGAVVFHSKAGSLADRRDRIAAVAAEIARQLGIDATRVADAARLAKADQVSYVVQEFAELEGFAGSLYARAGGHAEDVAMAIDQQFRPKGASAPLPEAGVPSVLALADKVELLATMFSIGEQPTGSRDPHGLRRAAIGVVRIILEHDLPLDVPPVIDAAFEAVESQGFAQREDRPLGVLHGFLIDRVEKRLVDDGVRIDAFRAAAAANMPRFQHDDGLARSFSAMLERSDAAFLGVLEAAKRCTNILEKAGGASGDVDVARFEAGSERVLHERLADLRPRILAAVEKRDFDEAVALAAQLGPVLDAFFDRETGVMVMADDAAVRTSRLALVRTVLDSLAPLGDLTELQVS